MATHATTLVHPHQSRSTTTGTSENAAQHSLRQSLALHLLPGVFILAIFLVAAPLAVFAGIPALMAMMVSAVVGFVFQVTHLFIQGKKRNGKWSLQGIVLNREPIPVWQYLVLVPIFTIVAFLINGLTAPLGAFFISQLTWLPDWFEMRSVAQLMSYPKWILAVLFGVYMLIDGIAAPIIEEMYFRGYLMPRLSRFGRWTAFIETALFTLYHFWQPYLWITIFFSWLPVAVAVSWKRNLKLGIITHAALNLIGGLLTFAQVLGS